MNVVKEQDTTLLDLALMGVGVLLLIAFFALMISISGPGQHGKPYDRATFNNQLNNSCDVLGGKTWIDGNMSSCIFP
jgi:hypothetical protein